MYLCLQEKMKRTCMICPQIFSFGSDIQYDPGGLEHALGWLLFSILPLCEPAHKQISQVGSCNKCKTQMFMNEYNIQI